MMQTQDEDDLHNLVRNAPIGICILDAATLVTEMVNSRFLEVVGKPYEEIYGKWYWEPLAQIRPYFEEAMAAVVQTGQAFYADEVELVLFRYGKEEQAFVTFVYSPVKSRGGLVTKVAVWALDNTQQVHARQVIDDLNGELAGANEEMMVSNEELSGTNDELTKTNNELARVNEQLWAAQHKIEESEVALRLAIDAANFGTWFIHSVTREFITDARLKELFGYFPNEDLSIEQALAQITDEYRGYVATKLENAIYNDGDYDVTYPVTGLNDNRLRWLRAIGNLKADPSGAFSAFTGVVMDITEQVQAKDRLQSAYEQLRLSKEAAQLGFFDMDMTAGTMVWDARCRELFGISHQDIVTYEKDFVTGLHPEDRERILSVIDSVFNRSVSNGVYDVEYRTVGAEDHQLRWVRAKGQAYFDKNDRPVRFIGSVLDITEQKQDELRKNDFIGMVSHELKTPLTSLSGYTQVLQERAKKRDDEFAIGAFAKIGSQIKKMTNMINSFLNVSRFDSGKIHLDLQTFNLNELMEELVEEAKLLAPAYDIIMPPCAPVWVEADRDKIGQVLSNLLSNAIKYSPKGKTIILTCRQTDRTVEVDVQDEGMGIRPESVDKLFDRFYRVETKNTQHISGFGIGLYLCSEIVRSHGGEIWAESKLGKGSIFHFSLPLAAQHKA